MQAGDLLFDNRTNNYTHGPGGGGYVCTPCLMLTAEYRSAAVADLSLCWTLVCALQMLQISGSLNRVRFAAVIGLYGTQRFIIYHRMNTLFVVTHYHIVHHILWVCKSAVLDTLLFNANRSGRESWWWKEETHLLQITDKRNITSQYNQTRDQNDKYY